MTEQPPPSYNDTTSATPHLILRAPPFPRPADITSHYINVVPYAAPTSFPYPEPVHLWLERDVRKEDWASFIANLLASPGTIAPKHDEKAELCSDEDKTIPGSAQRESTNDSSISPHSADFDVLQRMYGVIAEWNEGFFAPRGFKIVAGGNSDPSNDPQVKTGWKFGPDKYGFQIGNIVLGVDLSSSSSPTASPSLGDKKA